MMKIIKKNQLTILVLSLMLITAGYLNYNDKIQNSTEVAAIGDATLVSSNLSNKLENKIENQSNAVENNIINSTTEEVASSISVTEETVKTNSQSTNKEEYFTSSRLERDTMYSQMIESYQKILDSTTTTEKQKASAQEEID